MVVDRATQHRFTMVKKYLQRNVGTIKIEYFPVGSPAFNAVEECWRWGKCNLLSKYYPDFVNIKQLYLTIIEQGGLTWISKSICLDLRINIVEYTCNLYDRRKNSNNNNGIVIQKTN